MESRDYTLGCIADFLRDCKSNVDRVNCDEAHLKAHPVNEPLRHAIFGMVDESGEFFKTVKDKMYYNRPIDALNMVEEAGDFLWSYILLIEVLSNIFEIPFDHLFVHAFLMNKAKLKARYSGAGYTDYDATHRDLLVEREAMLESLGKYRKNVEGRIL